MRMIAAITLSIIVGACCAGCGGKKPVTILFTSDVRGRIHPAG